MFPRKLGRSDASAASFDLLKLFRRLRRRSKKPEQVPPAQASQSSECRLPAELLDIILECSIACRDRSTILALSSVCKRFWARAIPALYHSIEITHLIQLQRLWTCLIEMPSDVAAHRLLFVRHLWIGETQGGHQMFFPEGYRSFFIDMTHRLLQCCVNLESLYLVLHFGVDFSQVLEGPIPDSVKTLAIGHEDGHQLFAEIPKKPRLSELISFNRYSSRSWYNGTVHEFLKNENLERCRFLHKGEELVLEYMDIASRIPRNAWRVSSVEVCICSTKERYTPNWEGTEDGVYTSEDKKFTVVRRGLNGCVAFLYDDFSHRS